MSSYCHEMGFYLQDARLEPLYSKFFPRFFQQFSDCARVTLALYRRRAEWWKQFALFRFRIQGKY